MKRFPLIRLTTLIAPGALLLQFVACLGPNPGFYLSTSITGVVIGAIVERILDGILGPG